MGRVVTEEGVCLVEGRGCLESRRWENEVFGWEGKIILEKRERAGNEWSFAEKEARREKQSMKEDSLRNDSWNKGKRKIEKEKNSWVLLLIFARE